MPEQMVTAPQRTGSGDFGLVANVSQVGEWVARWLGAVARLHPSWNGVLDKGREDQSDSAEGIGLSFRRHSASYLRTLRNAATPELKSGRSIPLQNLDVRSGPATRQNEGERDTPPAGAGPRADGRTDLVDTHITQSDENQDPTHAGGSSVTDLTDEERGARLAALNSIIELMRPAVQADGGDLALLSADVVTGIVEVQLQGACSSCAVSSSTLQGGVERILRDRLDWVTEVLGGVDDSVDPFVSESMGRGGYVPSF